MSQDLIEKSLGFFDKLTGIGKYRKKGKPNTYEYIKVTCLMLLYTAPIFCWFVAFIITELIGSKKSW